MKRCEDEKMFYRPPLLEEPCAQTLSGKSYPLNHHGSYCFSMFSPKNPEITMVQGRAWRWIVLLLGEQQADRARGRDPLRHHQAALWPWSWVNHGKVRNEKMLYSNKMVVYHGLSWFTMVYHGLSILQRLLLGTLAKIETPKP